MSDLSLLWDFKYKTLDEEGNPISVWDGTTLHQTGSHPANPVWDSSALGGTRYGLYYADEYGVYIVAAPLDMYATDDPYSPASLGWSYIGEFTGNGKWTYTEVPILSPSKYSTSQVTVVGAGTAYPWGFTRWELALLYWRINWQQGINTDATGTSSSSFSTQGNDYQTSATSSDYPATPWTPNDPSISPIASESYLAVRQPMQFGYAQTSGGYAAASRYWNSVEPDDMTGYPWGFPTDWTSFHGTVAFPTPAVICNSGQHFSFSIDFSDIYFEKSTGQQLYYPRVTFNSASDSGIYVEGVNSVNNDPSALIEADGRTDESGATPPIWGDSSWGDGTWPTLITQQYKSKQYFSAYNAPYFNLSSGGVAYFMGGGSNNWGPPDYAFLIGATPSPTTISFMGFTLPVYEMEIDYTGTGIGSVSADASMSSMTPHKFWKWNSKWDEDTGEMLV